MPHQCVRCNTFHEDGAAEILKGCKCGGKLFFYIKQERLEEARKMFELNLSPDDKRQIELDILDMVGVPQDKPVVLDFECIRVLQPGKYEIDLVRLFKEDSLIFKLDEGKYVIDLAETFERNKKKP
jgi:predicted  nucleic acid-binding Zn-ribbon protein